MTIIIFLVSFFVISAIFTSKVFEIKNAKAHFLSRAFSMGDVKLNQLINFSIFKYNRYKKISNIFIFEFLPSFAYELLVKMKDYVSKKYYSAGDEFRGRRVLRSNGSVSFFLERLSDDKAIVETNKI